MEEELTHPAREDTDDAILEPGYHAGPHLTPAHLTCGPYVPAVQLFTLQTTESPACFQTPGQNWHCLPPGSIFKSHCKKWDFHLKHKEKPKTGTGVGRISAQISLGRQQKGKHWNQETTTSKGKAMSSEHLCSLPPAEPPPCPALPRTDSIPSLSHRLTSKGFLIAITASSHPSILSFTKYLISESGILPFLLHFACSSLNHIFPNKKQSHPVFVLFWRFL